jgi:hypothetical protein
LLLVLLILPAQLWLAYTPLFAQFQRESAATRQQWEAILAANPPDDAILISNDRNEIAPLFYLQTVEGRGVGQTGLFPLITPEDRFRDIGATVQSALDEGGTQPVYLIKPMDGLESRFTLEPRTPPLVEVAGAATADAASVPLNLPYGPLTLTGYAWTPTASGVEIALIWSVTEALPGDYTTTVQLFDADGDKLGQDDRPPGGVYYPTSLWKPGETLIDRHAILLQTDAQPARILIGMYTSAGGALLAPPLEFSMDEASQ